MAPTQRYSRENVTHAAFELIRREGPSAFNARSVAQELGSSTQPIFRLFTGMDELRNDVICHAADAFYTDMFARMDASARPYLEMGLCYLRFAKQEPQLFKLLFLRDRITCDDCCAQQEKAQYHALYERLAQSLQVNVQQAEALFSRAWLYTHGLAVSIATKYLPCLSEEEMGAMIVECWTAAAAHLGIPLAA